MNPINVVDFVKGGVGLVAGVGAGKIVDYAIKKVVPEALSKSDKVLIAVGTFAIGGVVAKMSSDFTEDLIQSTVDAGVKIINEFKNREEIIEEFMEEEPVNV